MLNECLGVPRIYSRQQPTTIVLYEGHLTVKSDYGVGHLNTTLARGAWNLNDPIFKRSNARGLPGWVKLKFWFDRRIIIWIYQELTLGLQFAIGAV